MNIQQIMKQAQAMQKKMQQQQEELANKEFTASSGGDLVTITLNGKGEVLKLKIDPSIIDKDDPEMLEDLIVACFNKAKQELDEESGSMMDDMAGGLGLPPGFKMPF